MEKLVLFDQAAALRDIFAKFVENNEREKAAEIKFFVDRWKPGKDLDERIERTNTEFAEKRQKKRDALLMEFDNAFEQTVAKIKGKVLHADSLTAVKMKALEDFPMTAIEFSILCEKYANTGYWVNKALQRLAEKNNIAIQKDVFDPDADVVIDVLTELRGRVIRFLDEAGTGSDGEIEALHPSPLKRLEDRLTAGTDPGFSPEKQARRALTYIASRTDIFAQANAIKNFLQTAPEDVRKQFLLGLESGWSRILDDSIRLSGADKLIDMQNKAHVENMKEARACVDELQAMGSSVGWYEAARTMAKHGGTANSELIAAVLEAFPDNKAITDSVDALQQISDGDSVSDQI